MNNTEQCQQVLPSLVINITDSCNLQCQYCPPYGENLAKGKQNFDIEVTERLIDLAKNAGIKLVRFTGGEPILFPERVERLINRCGDFFKRLVLNTNGLLLAQNLYWLKNYKDRLILKISLDSIDAKEYNDITKHGELLILLNNIDEAIRQNFYVEINTVIYNQSPKSVIDVIKFVLEKGIDMKLLTTSSFYDNIKTQNSVAVRVVYDWLNNNLQHNSSERLASGAGVSMLSYSNGRNKVLLIDHAVRDSLTPNKLYFTFCKEKCSYYPCDSGALSITLSTDGILTPCRGRKDLGTEVFSLGTQEVDIAFKKGLDYFKKCVEINLNGGQTI
ncbi:MAG: radical SAM protein [Clostridiales bacterium]|nr:radical SAM protein [Clostridiales bacterium]